MFWAAARRKYADVSSSDPDVQKFHRLAHEFQTDVYGGVTGALQDLGHRWVARHTPAGPVLEIGFGAGRHRLFAPKREDYFVSDYSAAHARSPAWKEMAGRTLRCDAAKLPFPDATFSAVLSIYNLEHIQDLAGVFAEVHRVLRDTGKFLIGLPCEGGFLWNLGRELVTRPMFERKYGVNYDKVIAYEHVRDFAGVCAELQRCKLFEVRSRRFFPLMIPSVHFNIVVGLACLKK